MNTKGDKRTFENGTNLSPPGTSKKQKTCYSPEKTNAVSLAKKTMASITSKFDQYKCEDENTRQLIKFVRGKITKLDTGVKKKTTIGVFGKTGAGKSSLINAILGEEVLPSGSINACTSVIIQVEASISDSNYTAEIEFITKQDWEYELKTLLYVLLEGRDGSDKAMFKTAKEKITALYGKKDDSITIDELMKEINFSEIPEFLKSETKKITCEKASDLFDKTRCYIQHDESNPGGCYWPIVKSVTIKVPHCEDFLEHVVLVDLPGVGDYNKSRDQMWKSKLRECSSVWIVSEIERAGSDKDAWELISNNITDMAQGGECRSISFICTKTDVIIPKNYMRSSNLKDGDLQITAEDPECTIKRKIACILHRNTKAKGSVRENFHQQDTIKRHFSCDDDDDFFTVYTVSSAEFTTEDPILKPEDTEIPKLKDNLRTCSNMHRTEMTNYYISGALGILNLIRGYNEIFDEMMEEGCKLCNDLEQNLQDALGCLHDQCVRIRSLLEKLISKGVKKSEEKCIETAKEIIEPKDKNGRGFHQTLTALCRNDGYHRSRTGEIDLNTHLAKHMFEHIDKTFSEFFPAQGPVTEKSLQAHIDKFTIITEELIKKYYSPLPSGMLDFLKIGEMQLKTSLKYEIVEKKKKMYASIPESIKTTMQQIYKRAAEHSGTGSMKVKQTMLLEHIESSKSEMFQKAKREMLQMMEYLMHSIVEQIRTELKDLMEHSLRCIRMMSFIDISTEIEYLKRLKFETDQVSTKGI